MAPEWASEYIGLPFAEKGRDRNGLDCWGLVRLVLAERFGIEVPAYLDYGDTDDHAGIAGLTRGETGDAGPWIRVLPGSERPGDVVLMRLSGLPIHCGVVVASGWMLHVMRGIDVCLERYEAPRWARRVTGVYRYAG